MAKTYTSTPATDALTRAGVRFTEHAYEHDANAESFGLEAAEALGLDPSHVFKTLLVDMGGKLAVGVVPVAGKLDLKALAKALGVKKVSMAAVPLAEKTTGYVAGGISPFGQKRHLTTVVDESAIALDRVYVSGGRRGFDIGVDPRDLVSVTGATVASIGTAS